MPLRGIMLCPEPPYPPIGGGRLRTASLIEYLAGRCDLDLILFQVEGEADPSLALPKGLARDVLRVLLPAHRRDPLSRITRNCVRLLRGRPPLLDRFSSSDLSQLLKGRHYDFALIEHFWCAPFAETLQSHCKRIYLDLHNIESAWHASAAASEPWPYRLAHRRFARLYRRWESRLLPQFKRILVTSQSDAAQLPPLAPRVIVYPNSLPSLPMPDGRLQEQAIVFSGNLEYLPNRQAVRFFHRRVWPLLRARHRDLVWRIVGRNPCAVEKLVAGDARIQLRGAVENAVCELSRSCVAVVPLLSGSGTRVKILEAWAAGLPVVSTTLGAQGLEAVPGRHLLIGDAPEAFAQAVSHLLESEQDRRKMGSAGRELYEKRYSWPAAWRILDQENFPEG